MRGVVVASPGSNKRKDRARTGVVVAALAGPEVRVLQAVRRSADVVIQRWGSAEGATDDEGQARALVQALQQAGITERRVVLNLAARSVVMKRVQLPPASPEQLPQLVAYEAQRHLPLPLDQLATGFQEIPGTVADGQSGTQVLVAVARKNDLTRLERAMNAVGVQVQEYGVEALGITDAYLHGAVSSHNGGAWLLLAAEEGGLHAQVLRGDRLLFARYLPFNEGEWKSDLRRSLTAFSLEHPEAPIEEVVLLGPGNEAELSQAVGQPVRRTELQTTHTGEAPPPAWAPLVGLAHQYLGAGRYPLSVDAQGWTDDKRAGNRSQVVVGAVAALALVAVFALWQYDRQRLAAEETAQAGRALQQSVKDREALDVLLQKRDRLREQLTAMGGEGGKDGQPDVPPLELLRQVTEGAPPGVWLTHVNYASDKPLQLEGSTRNAAQINRFMSSLEHLPGFRRVEVGYVRSAAVNDTPVTHFRIDCTLNAGKVQLSSAAVRREGTR